MKIFTATFPLLVILSFLANAQQHIFTNVTTQVGISGQTGLGHSVGWCDIDNDGDLDLAFSNQDGSGFWLYRNNGNDFTDITSSAGLSGQGANKILWAEVTNDTYTDLILNSYLFKNNGDGTFTNITGGSGISGSPYSAADFDKDGYNDLLRISPDVAVLYNNGDNSFTASVIEGASYWAVTCLDYDLDGWLDIYLGTYGTAANKLYRNLGDGTFGDVTAAANATYNDAAQGLASGDCNNDGFPDLYIGSYGNLSCRLLLNQGDGTFADATSASGTSGHNDTRTVSFNDYNNDGWLDIFSSHHDFYTYSNTLLRNNGDGTFTEVAVQMGLSGQFIGDYFGVGWGHRPVCGRAHRQIQAFQERQLPGQFPQHQAGREPVDLQCRWFPRKSLHRWQLYHALGAWRRRKARLPQLRPGIRAGREHCCRQPERPLDERTGR